MVDRPLTGRAGGEALGVLMRLGASGQRINARKLTAAVRSPWKLSRLRVQIAVWRRQRAAHVAQRRWSRGRDVRTGARLVQGRSAPPDRPRSRRAA